MYCKACGGDLPPYKGVGKYSVYCSDKCCQTFKRYQTVCSKCGEIKLSARPIKEPHFCHKCSQLNRRSEKAWLCASRGYHMIYSGDRRRRCIPEHIKIMESVINEQIKYPRGVHHIDFVKSNNDISNLWVFANAREHHDAENSLHKLLPQLLKSGIILFKDGVYELGVLNG